MIKRTAVIVLLAVGIGSGIGMVGVKMMTGSEQPVGKAQTSERAKEEKAAQTASATESVGKAEKKSEQESKDTSAAASTLDPFPFTLCKQVLFHQKLLQIKQWINGKKRTKQARFFT